MGLKNGQSKNADRQTCLKDGKKDSHGSNTEEGRMTPDEIKHNKQCNFTPPWTNSPGSLNKKGMYTVHRWSSINSSMSFTPKDYKCC